MTIRSYCQNIFITILLTALLSGCALRPRSANAIPVQLHRIYLSTENPYNTFTTQLKAMLQSLNVTLVQSPQNAPYTMDITQYEFSQSNATITTTNLATTFTYTLSMQITILNSAGTTLIGPKSLSASRSVVQNASQVYTPGTATLAKQELRRDIISQLYYVLVSGNTRRALTKRNKSPKHTTAKSHVY